jgi:hypothetical protein
MPFCRGAKRPTSKWSCETRLTREARSAAAFSCPGWRSKRRGCRRRGVADNVRLSDLGPLPPLPSPALPDAISRAYPTGRRHGKKRKRPGVNDLLTFETGCCGRTILSRRNTPATKASAPEAGNFQGRRSLEESEASSIATLSWTSLICQAGKSFSQRESFCAGPGGDHERRLRRSRSQDPPAPARPAAGPRAGEKPAVHRRKVALGVWFLRKHGPYGARIFSACREVLARLLGLKDSAVGARSLRCSQIGAPQVPTPRNGHERKWRSVEYAALPVRDRSRFCAFLLGSPNRPGRGEEARGKFFPSCFWPLSPGPHLGSRSPGVPPAIKGGAQKGRHGLTGGATAASIAEAVP